jgi:hypothetical protein
MSAPFSQRDALTWWEQEGEAKAFRRIREAVGSPPANAKHAAEYACDVVGQMLRERVEQSTTSLTAWTLGRFTCYYRSPEQTETQVARTKVWIAPESPLTEDSFLVVAGAKMALPWVVEEMHRLGDSLDQWALPAPADWWTINGDDGAPSGEGA